MKLRDYPDEYVLTQGDCYDGPNPPHPFPGSVKTNAVWRETKAKNGLHAFLVELIEGTHVATTTRRRFALCGALDPTGREFAPRLSPHSACCLKCDKMLREDTFTTEERKAANYAYGAPVPSLKNEHGQALCDQCGLIVGGGRDGERCDCFPPEWRNAGERNEVFRPPTPAEAAVEKGVANRRWVGKCAGLAKRELVRAVELYKTRPRRVLRCKHCNGVGWTNNHSGPCRHCNPSGDDPVECPKCGALAESCSGYGWVCPNQGKGCERRPWGRD